MKSLINRKLSNTVKNIQSSFYYRRLVRKLRPNLYIYEFNHQCALKIKYFEEFTSAIVTNYIARSVYTVVGVVQLVRHTPEDYPYIGYWVRNLVVWPIWRRMGIGEILTKRVINQAAKEGARDLSLIVEEENKGAYNLYMKLGFGEASIPVLNEQLDQLWRQSGKRFVIMRKFLAL